MVSFVGRQPELAVLRARLTDAVAELRRSSRSRGLPESARPRLLDHFLREAGDADPPVVVRASGEETEELLAYGIVDQLARSAGQDGGALTGIDAGERPGDGRHPRLLEFLDGLDSGTGVVLVVDEAHWADRPSMHGVVFALRRLVADRVLAVVALRDDRVADMPDSLGRLVAGQRGTVLRLRGLDEVDLHDLAVAVGVPGARRPRRAPAALRDAGKPVAREGSAGGVPAVRVAGRRDGGGPAAAAAAVVPAAGPGPLRRVRAGHAAAHRGRCRAGPALSAAAGRRAGRDRAAAPRAGRGDRG